jgi:hypothetical protein
VSRLERQVLWQAWTGPGLESLRVSVDDGGVRAESVAIGVSGGRAYTVRYALPLRYRLACKDAGGVDARRGRGEPCALQ